MTKFWISPDEKLPNNLQIVVAKNKNDYALCVFVNFDELMELVKYSAPKEIIDSVVASDGFKHRVVFALLSDIDKFCKASEIEHYFPLPEYFEIKNIMPEKLN